MRKKGVFIVSLLTFSFGALFLIRAATVEKKVSIVGTKTLISDYLNSEEGKLPQTGAVTFMGTANEKGDWPLWCRLRLDILGVRGLRKGLIKIYTRDCKNGICSKKFYWHDYISPYGEPTIDGRDHNLNGGLIKNSNSVPAVATNTKLVRVKFVKRIPKKIIINKELDLTKVIEYLEKNADVVITKDTECNEDGCFFSGGGKKVEYNLGTKEHPKIVIVKGARLTLKENFKGYGVLILTGERKNVPELGFSDEIKKIRCKITGRTLTDLLREIKGRLQWGFVGRVRNILRLSMNDSATWYGVVISDLSSPVLITLGRQTYYPTPIPVPKPHPIYKPINKPFSFWNIIGGTAYAKRLKESEPYPSVFSGKKDLESKPPEKKPLKEKVKKPEIGRVKIYGAVLIKASFAAIRMNSADILYSSQAISLVDNMISSLPFTWEKFKEEK